MLPVYVYSFLPEVCLPCLYRLKVFEDTLERRIFEHGRRFNRKTGFCSWELYSLFSLPRMITAIKSRRMGWVRYVACMEMCIQIFNEVI